MSLVRAALSQLADSTSYGILGINRTCWGASTSGASLPSSISGLRLLRTLAGSGDDRVPLSFSARLTADPPFQLSSAAASSSTAGAPSAPTPQSSSPWLPALGASLRPLFATSPRPPLGQQLRGYKSNKRSLKPLNTAATWQAVQPLLAEQRQRAAVEGVSPQDSADGGRSPPPQPGRRRWRPRLGPIVDTCLPPIPAVPLPVEYKRVGMITGQYELEPERTFAVVELAGSQYKVTTDDVLFVNQLKGVDVNDVLALERVLLLGSRAETVVGRPYVPGGVVLAAVEEHFRDGKVHVFKKKRRKRYRKYQAPRPHLTTLRILQVRGIDPAPGDESARLPELPVALLDARYESVLRLAGRGEQRQEEVEEQRQVAV
ncbi:hypothetical protein HYH02_002375 [Chlamydomonas schloesseri]|uniref:Large ribosomal subunit protein bL21m n=1 Tax=Chlamydomonas schloesseri TaxID=2026947 RepID=A0A835WSS7_9CHLO|nr:hypothetical protein HYH02_002375 [Chlamydomonas schloesseri]|eukprot:KAG2453040.1 hypothetical protein HYH02_002375 [Chlamydomonas schloesseri]